MTDTSGPAFPYIETRHHHHVDSNDVTTERVSYPGMTLRQWYAGMALQGILCNGADPSNEPTPEDTALVSTWAYKFADAMLQQGGA